MGLDFYSILFSSFLGLLLSALPSFLFLLNLALDLTGFVFIVSFRILLW